MGSLHFDNWILAETISKMCSVSDVKVIPTATNFFTDSNTSIVKVLMR